ncbi:MAG: hypothetical protein IKR84_01840 [Oscillibacter sp.]|nr:hypothetical protein [Oscillibacter sp.]
MGYEALYEALQPWEKGLRDSAGAVNRLQKAARKNTETGNLPELRRNLAALEEAQEQLRQRIAGAREALEGFDAAAYLADGDFARELLEACAGKGIDVRGEKGAYEMFPFKLRILSDGESRGEIYLDKKKLPSCRPAYVAETIRERQARLYAAPFRESAFMGELAEAYTVSCLRAGVREGSTQALTKIYKCLAPTARARKDYDMLSYAFDLARLYEKGPESWVTKDGRRYTFGTSREGNGIRVLSRSGVESFISTLRPLQSEEA